MFILLNHTCWMLGIVDSVTRLRTGGRLTSLTLKKYWLLIWQIKRSWIGQGSYIEFYSTEWNAPVLFTIAQQLLAAQGLLSIEDSLSQSFRHTTVSRTPLDEWSAQRRYLYLTTHNTHNRQTSMPPAGFEPAISAGELPQTNTLEPLQLTPPPFFLVFSRNHQCFNYK